MLNSQPGNKSKQHKISPPCTHCHLSSKSAKYKIPAKYLVAHYMYVTFDQEVATQRHGRAHPDGCPIFYIQFSCVMGRERIPQVGNSEGRGRMVQ